MQTRLPLIVTTEDIWDSWNLVSVGLATKVVPHISAGNGNLEMISALLVNPDVIAGALDTLVSILIDVVPVSLL